MSGWLYLAAGPDALAYAKQHALARGGDADSVIACGDYGGDMRSQEAASLFVQKDIVFLINEREGDDITVFVSVGQSAGALLVLVEAAHAGALVRARRRVGAVVLLPKRVTNDVSEAAHAELELLGQALWTYTLDGRLHWSMVTDSSSFGLSCAEQTQNARRKFGSRLYGE